MPSRLHIQMIVTAMLLLASMVPHSARADDPPAKARERIGVYDSRAIAIAYAGSTCLKQEQQELTAKHKRAKATGDEKEASRLEAKGAAKQARLYRQGFSTEPVDDLLTYVAKVQPQIRDAAGLTTIVSKWSKPELNKHPKVERVDVTMQLVDAFAPDERARKNAIEIQKKDPIPPTQLDKKH